MGAVSYVSNPASDPMYVPSVTCALLSLCGMSLKLLRNLATGLSGRAGDLSSIVRLAREIILRWEITYCEQWRRQCFFRQEPLLSSGYAKFVLRKRCGCRFLLIFRKYYET